MNFSIRAIIRGLVARNYQLSCSSRIWQECLGELAHRGQGEHESGAFLLGSRNGTKRTVEWVVYFDDLEPNCLDYGIVKLSGEGYGKLWELCRTRSTQVIADVHTHPGLARQSSIDCENPLIAVPGHVAIIVPNFAQHLPSHAELGIYEYLGNHRWKAHLHSQASNFFYIGYFG